MRSKPSSFRALRVGAVCLSGWLALSAVSADTPELPLLRGLSRSDLLQTAPTTAGKPRAQTPLDWESRKLEALEAFQKVAGRLPREEMRCPLDPVIEQETDCGSYVRRLISYASSPDGRVPAYLCIPKAALLGKPAPAVLCLHPTDDQTGHGVVVGLGGKPNRQYAAELAERGFVTLSPSYPLLAKYQPNLKALGFCSGTMKAVWDNIRGLDLLETLPFVRKDAGFATIGHSLGGHNSIFTAALDPRLRVIISSCGFDSFLDYKEGRLNGWIQQRYMPEMEAYLGHPEQVPFDFYELAAALAPRPFLINAPLGDSNFNAASVDRIVAATVPVYAMYGAEKNLRVLHPQCAHDFPDEARLEAYKLIQKVLGNP